MIPMLAAVGVSMLSTLAGKTITALIERDLGGGTTVDSGKGSFEAILERSQAMQSSRTPAKRVDPLPSQGVMPTVVGDSARSASIGLQTAGLATYRTPASRTALLAAPPWAVSPGRAGDLIGRKIAANGSVFELRGQIPTLHYHLPTVAASVQIEVRDLRGTVVRTVQLGSQPGGLHRISFDGRGLPSGLYLYRVVAADAAGQPIARVSTAYGRVLGVRFEGGQPLLNVGSALVPLAGVFEVSTLQPSAIGS